jgi:tripartite-type tricarboxylate transporter receptor subunit TctC
MSMKKRIIAAALVLTIAAALFAAGGAEETKVYPQKDIQFIVPFPIGGSTGTPAQILINYLNNEFPEVEVVLSQITGAGGSVGARHVMNEKNDGYTFLIAVPGFSVQRVLAGLDFTFRDFEQVAAYGSAEQVLVVRGDSEYRDFNDLIEAARKNPGKLNVGAPVGTSLQMATLAIEEQMGVDFNIVDIGGVSVKPPELLSGRVEAYIDSTAKTIPYIESGDFRAIGIWGPERSGFLPGVPALNEFGFDMVLEEVQGIWALKDTPVEILTAIEGAMKNVLANPEFVAKFEGDTFTKVSFLDRESYVKFLEEYERTCEEAAAKMM